MDVTRSGADLLEIDQARWSADLGLGHLWHALERADELCGMLDKPPIARHMPSPNSLSSNSELFLARPYIFFV